jgi:UDP-sugar pyrophosphorylase
MLSWAFGSDSEKKSKPKVLPPGLAKITHLLTDEQVDLMVKLCSPELDQKHLFEHWPTTEGVDESPAIKKGFVQQLEALDKAYPKGGLAAYIKKSRALVQADKNQAQLKSLDHWKPTAPLGQTFELGTEEHEDVESIGMREVHSLGFVLLASGVKLGLQSELATGAAYLGLCIRYVLALQMKHCKKTRKIPLCVITSEDQKENLLKIFEKNKYFGLLETQVTILTEPQRMPAFIDSSGKFAIDPRDPYKLLLVPHGNGDVHKLLHTSGVADKWYERGTKWISVIADTNALAYHTIPLALGVSIKHDLIMNTTAIPRKANEETGAIMKLIHKRTDETWYVCTAICLEDEQNVARVQLPCDGQKP